ncbi:M14 family metallopeptidase [soil metagenome]
MLPLPPPSDLTLKSEKTGFIETGRYQEAIDFCHALARKTPKAKVIEYGKSPEGRPMIALLLSDEGNPSLDKMRKSKKPVVFVQNGIHSGEIEGKDASLILAREMAVTGEKADLLKGLDWVIVPVFSVDAHERFSPYNRINQNGPKEMGWRSTAQNLNLNRDWIKADAPEMQNEIALVQRLRPDFLFDNHTTDGSDHQYPLTISVPWWPEIPPATVAFQKALYKSVVHGCENDGFLTAPYFGLADPEHPEKGLSVEAYGPRYSHGYWTWLGRPSMLVETHVLKDYKTRVFATEAAMVETAKFLMKNAAEVKRMNQAADIPPKPGETVVLSSKISDEKEPFTFKAYVPDYYDSAISGGRIQRWDRTKPIDVPTQIRWNYEPDVTAPAPTAYVVPGAWKEVVAKLKLHGIVLETLTKPRAVTGQTVLFSEVRFPATPFESRFQPSYKTETIQVTREMPPGSVIAKVDQPNGRLLMAMLEPSAPDAFVKWGLFNTIFEQKEYGEDYAIEPVAQKMLAEDPKLKAEFEERLKDPKFAASPGARLNFFYSRSPWWDDHLDIYPILRLP